ncbi:hypothetical protein NUW58_g1684 [Xylaria curta]|uniref:Uncharacterized protein n=1 Tax=Xylaria curta TaxID=42375 RepID=A0ACC1PMD5_9PEZI|nr:hypothetical protein NUW58_g1684 [Xylaria curta]
MALGKYKMGPNDAMTSAPSPNDHYSNIAAAEMAKLAAEKAKKEAVDKLAVDAEQLAKDLKTALEDKENYERRAALLYDQDESSKAKLQTMDVVLKAEREEKERFQREAMRVHDCYKTSKAKLEEAETELKSLRQPLNEKNNLDPSFHNREVTIALLVMPFTAVDFGGDRGLKPHGWSFNLTNWNQRLRIKKANTSDRHSPWTIEYGDRYLALMGGPDNYGAILRGRCSGSEAQAQEWYIGHIENGWILHNVRYDLALDMVDPTIDRDGKALRGCSRNPNANSQVFLIVFR